MSDRGVGLFVAVSVVVALAVAVVLGTAFAAPWWMPSWTHGPLWGVWFVLGIALGVLGLAFGLAAGVVGVLFGLAVAVAGVALGLAIPLAPIALIVLVVWFIARGRGGPDADVGGEPR